MGCEELKDLIPLYAGGEAYENERLAVEAHLPQCPDCARELEQVREMRGFLAELREGTLPPGTEARMWRDVRDEMFPHRRRTRSLDWAIRSAAVLVVGLAVGFFAVTVGGRRGPKPQAPVKVASLDTVVDAGSAARSSIGGADFAGSQPSWSFGGWTFPDEPTLRYALPRASRSEGSHYLPRVEAVVADGERDF